MTSAVSSPLRSAASDAVSFLLARQDPSGSWRDFLLPAGSSNLWVTAFVGLALADFPGPGAREAALAGWRFLEQQTLREGGWSYNPAVPGDADSTLWGIRLAQALGVADSPCGRAAAQFLETHITPDGGLATYATAETVRRYIGLPINIPFCGWTQSHVCVTAAGASLDAYRARLIPFLLTRQSSDGQWPAYWWFDDEYATAEAATALAARANTADRASLERAVDWALQRCEFLLAAERESTPVFAIAHALRILVLTDRPARVAKTLAQGVAAVRRAQRPDGSWPPSARLRVPRPDVISPNDSYPWAMWSGMSPTQLSVSEVLRRTFTIYTPDHFAIYTTATVVRALQEIVANPTLA